MMKSDTTRKTKSNKRLVVSTMILLLLALWVPGCAQNQDTIKLGYIGPLSGDAAMLGIEASNALALEVSEINRQGGVDGKKVELIVEDDQYDTSKSITAYDKLAHTEGVETIVMSTYGGVFAVADNAKQDDILIVDALDCDKEISRLPENVFCVAKETQDLAETLANFTKVRGFGKIGILHSTTDNFMPSVATLFREGIDQNARVTVEPYDKGTNDFATQLLKIKDVDAIVFLGYDEIGAAMKQAMDLGMNQTWMTIPSVATSPSIQAASKGAMDGVYFSFYAPLETNPNAKRFYSDYKNKYGREPIVNVASDQAYDTGKILLTDVLRITNGTTKAKRMEQKITALMSLKDFPGVTGKLSMGEDRRIDGIAIRLYQLKNMTPMYVAG